MAVYWLSFRLADGPTYPARYDAFVDAVEQMKSMWWVETSAFFVFETTLDINAVAARAKAAIDPARDIALIGMPEFKNARIIGAFKDQDIFKLMPFTKKA